MHNLLTIELRSLRFFAYHGLYEAEKKTGNEFEVGLFVEYAPAQGIITDIRETINYVQLYAQLKEEMEKPRELLETLAMEIVENMQAAFPMIKHCSIRITKLHPPIAGFTGTVGISYKKDFG